MTYAKNSTITAIHRPITNGMYNDTYTVIYSNGIRRNYTIKGAMNKKHFEFIQSATVESRYSKHTGKHTADIFTAPAEPKEEPTTEEQAAEEPTTTDTPADNNEEANNMRTYTAYVTDKNSKQSYFVTADYNNKKAFAEDLRRNGYAVHYIATPYTIDAVSDSYNKRREYRNEVARNTRAAAKAHSEATAEELIEAVENLCTRTADSRAEVDQMIEETEAMIKAQEKALEEARAKDRAAAEEARAAEAEEENQEEEKPTENPTDSAFIAEMVEALKYFKRVLWSYIDGTRYERDISGDFWGAHECSVILRFVNDCLKAQGAEPYYKLNNDFDSLTECFEEIMQKFEYGDERTIEEIILEYNFS
jgi:hypothetical protein